MRAALRVKAARALDGVRMPGYGEAMSPPVHDPEPQTEAQRAARSREHPAAPPATTPPERSLEWASAVGNDAVQRVARRSVAREAIEEEPELEEPQAAGEDVAEAGPDASASGPAEDLAPEEAEGLDALDELPEDELPE